MVFEEVLKLITEHDLVYALGMITGVLLYGSFRCVLALMSYFSKPRKPKADKTEEPDVPWWEKNE